MRLFEQYRPRTWDEVVGQDKAIGRIRQLAKRGLGGRAYHISGPSGVGKTTIARLIAGELADPFCTEELDATTLTPARLQAIERAMSLYGWGPKGGRAYIINESHGLRRDTIRQLLVLLERLPDHVVFIFTTTRDGLKLFEDGSEDAAPLLSRCTEIALTSQGLAKPGAAYLKEIAQSEGLDGQPLQRYVRLMRDCHNNLRKALQKIEDGAMLP